MSVFLSASVPKVGRGNFYENADPFLIQVAIRELVTSIIRTNTLIWGGHPSITPMIWAVCKDLGINYAERVYLYQSRLFEDDFPEENMEFGNVTYVDRVDNDVEASLANMRLKMLTDHKIDTGVFIGGMEGIFNEHALLQKHQPLANRIILTSPGGAAQQLSKRPLTKLDVVNETIDFARLFDKMFPSPALEPKPPRRMGP